MQLVQSRRGARNWSSGFEVGHFFCSFTAITIFVLERPKFLKSKMRIKRTHFPEQLWGWTEISSGITERWVGTVTAGLKQFSARREDDDASLSFPLTLKGFIQWLRRSQEGDVFQDRRGPQIVPRIWESYWGEEGVDTKFILIWGPFKAWLHAQTKSLAPRIEKGFLFFFFFLLKRFFNPPRMISETALLALGILASAILKGNDLPRCGPDQLPSLSRSEHGAQKSRRQHIH